MIYVHEDPLCRLCSRPQQVLSAEIFSRFRGVLIPSCFHFVLRVLCCALILRRIKIIPPMQVQLIGEKIIPTNGLILHGISHFKKQGRIFSIFLHKNRGKIETVCYKGMIIQEILQLNCLWYYNINGIYSHHSDLSSGISMAT